MLTFMYSDGAAVRKVLQGNQGAFRVLVERYSGVVHGVAYAHLRNAADAEDIVQETFTRLYQHLDRMAHYKRVGPWLVNVARNVSVDLVRKRGRESAAMKAAGAPRAAVQSPVREELHRLLWEQLDALDGESREVLILYYFMKKRARGIAALLEISPAAAAKRVQRARDDLGRRLSDLLGDELEVVKHDNRLTSRVMAAVAAAPVGWKASAGAAGAAATEVKPAEALAALGDRIVAQTEAGQYGKFYFDSVAEGDYVVVAVALAEDAEFDVDSVLEGRMAFSEAFHAGAGSVVEVGVTVE